jgi:hypothetical protein
LKPEVTSFLVKCIKAPGGAKIKKGGIYTVYVNKKIKDNRYFYLDPELTNGWFSKRFIKTVLSPYKKSVRLKCSTHEVMFP